MLLQELTAKIDGRLVGDGDVVISTVSSLGDAGEQAVSFLSDDRYADQLSQTKAAAVIVPKDFEIESPPVALIYVANVDEALIKTLTLFAPEADVPSAGVHPTAFVDPTAVLSGDVAVGPQAIIGANVTIGPGSIISAGCVIGRDVAVGDNCHLWPNVTVHWGCNLGNSVIIHSGTVIGTDGYGYSLINGKHCKVPHIGIVVIEDDVEIGACCCIDRAKFDKTVVGCGTKIDNMVQIGHNTIIGKNCLLVAQVGIAGSVKLGNYVVLAGRSGAADHVNIGDGAILTAQAVATKDVPPGSKMIDIPARDVREFVREVKMMKKLPKIIKKVESLT